MFKQFDVVRLVSGETVTILELKDERWFEVEFIDDRDEGCPLVETINIAEIECAVEH